MFILFTMQVILYFQILSACGFQWGAFENICYCFSSLNWGILLLGYSRESNKRPLES